jgi:hypothetical protein
MEIHDVGLPSWQLELPGGMILKMTSAQGALFIPDEEETPDSVDIMQLRETIRVGNEMLANANAEIVRM